MGWHPVAINGADVHGDTFYHNLSAMEKSTCSHNDSNSTASSKTNHSATTCQDGAIILVEVLRSFSRCPRLATERSERTPNRSQKSRRPTTPPSTAGEAGFCCLQNPVKTHCSMFKFSLRVAFCKQ